MKQLTIRGFSTDLEKKLLLISRKKGISLNKTAMELMRKGAGLSEIKGHCIGDSLDEFIGSWTKAQEKEVLDAVSVFEEIDEELWR